MRVIPYRAIGMTKNLFEIAVAMIQRSDYKRNPDKSWRRARMPAGLLQTAGKVPEGREKFKVDRAAGRTILEFALAR